ncbi:MAG: metallophosphoesterase family protein [Balneola sp.]
MTRIAIISDIHANLPALEAVFLELDKYKPDKWLCLGDIVGYGPYPSECIDLIKERKIQTVLGNHDAGVAGIIGLNHFRDPNRKLIALTRKKLSKDQLEWLKELPVKIENTKENYVAVHASPIEPLKWAYVDSAIKARKIIDKLNHKICFVGHTHMPAIVADRIGVMNFEKDYRYLINPGSVGQSRDGDYRASCMLLDIEKGSIETLRVEYPIEKVLSKLIDLGFSSREAHQLLRY